MYVIKTGKLIEDSVMEAFTELRRFYVAMNEDKEEFKKALIKTWPYEAEEKIGEIVETVSRLDELI